MANIYCDWKAECEHCGLKLGENYGDDKCPDRWDFDTEICSICDEEVCKNCRGKEKDIHETCESEEDEEE